MMNLMQVAFAAAGSLCVAYSLWHTALAIFSDTYDPPTFAKPSPAGTAIRFIDGLRLVAMGIGYVLIGLQLGPALLWWMPSDWGTEYDGEFQSYRERLGQALGGVMGLMALTVPSRAADKAIPDHLLPDFYRWLDLRKGGMSVRKGRHALFEIGLDHEFARLEEEEATAKRREEDAKQRAVEERRIEAEERQERESASRRARAQQAVDLVILKAMTSEELKRMWHSRPLVSWGEPMRSTSLEQQYDYWTSHLEITCWDIPDDLRRTVEHRLWG